MPALPSCYPRKQAERVHLQKRSPVMSQRLLTLLIFASILPVLAAKPKIKATQTNSDDMWVTSPVPELPTHVTHHTFRSASMNRDIGYCIYLPPTYDQDTNERFPVIYHLHGAGGNETRSVYSASVLHEGIMAETMMVHELIPHIDATYRTLADRKARCIEGFSMGGRGSTNLAMKHPQMFGSLFNQSGNVYHVSDPSKLPNAYLGDDPERLRANDAFLNLKKNLDFIKANLRIQVACGTADPEHLVSVREFHQALTEAGMPHSYFEVEGLDHNQKKMIDGRKATWFDFQIESLKLNQVPLHYLQP